jgi:hypothetical protein
MNKRIWLPLLLATLPYAQVLAAEECHFSDPTLCDCPGRGCPANLPDGGSAAKVPDRQDDRQRKIPGESTIKKNDTEWQLKKDSGAIKGLENEKSFRIDSNLIDR